MKFRPGTAGRQLLSVEHGIAATCPHRAIVAAHDRGEVHPVAASNPHFERAALCRFPVAKFWRLVVQNKNEFKVSLLNSDKDLLLQLHAQIAEFLDLYVKNVVDTDKAEPEGVRYLTRLRMGGTLTYHHEDENADLSSVAGGLIVHLNSLLADSISTSFSLVELATHFVMLNSGASLDTPRLMGLLKSEQFTLFIASLGFSINMVQNAFLVAQSVQTMKAGTIDRIVLNPHCLKATRLEEGEVLVFTDPALRVLQARYDLEVDESRLDGGAGPQKRMCTAGQVMGEEDLVLIEFASWMADLAIQYYVPRIEAKYNRGEYESKALDPVLGLHV